MHLSNAIDSITKSPALNQKISNHVQLAGDFCIRPIVVHLKVKGFSYFFLNLSNKQLSKFVLPEINIPIEL